MNDTLVQTATALVTHCRNGTETQGLDELYHADAVSAEPMARPDQDSNEVYGRAAIHKKHEEWNAAFEVHSADLTGPYYHGADRFGMIFQIDATHKETGQHFKATEFGVYTIDEGGKIVREEFFFNPMAM